MPSVPNSAPDKTVAGVNRNHGANPVLAALGERVRALRERRGLTRKTLSSAAGISERHLANLEYGEGNVSVLVLTQIADALNASLAELTGDFTTRSPEWLMLRSLLRNRSEDTLRRIRIAAGAILGGDQVTHSTPFRIALIGLRGAGKTTLGTLLAGQRGVPFVELSREIEQTAGCTIGEMHDLYGYGAYRRYERRALEDVIESYPEAVIAVPGGLVSDPATFNRLLSGCTTVWLRAKPEDHMQRVVEQGDFRPMTGAEEAMDDLRNILAARKPFYSQAHLRLDTSGSTLQQTFTRLVELVGAARQRQETLEVQRSA